ncbi:MAG: ATP-dependent RecD-like DNA helicase, partial [Clostridiales bacterium]|nr:ATP-dependent RecD-like DNA helicase [Clostridiales bacterium]
MDQKYLELQTVSGTIENVIYKNEENGYSVVEIGSDDGTELFTAVGTIPYIAQGESITLYGRWMHHPEYGRQFRVENYEKRLPADEGAILRYLSSRTVKGIGPATAAKIVERFGTDTFDVMENHPEWLAQISGISLAGAKTIGENFRTQIGIRSVILFCQEFFGPSTAVRVYKQWGASAIDIIKENPYRLCDDIAGIGFESADRIAQSLGFAVDSPARIESGILYALSYNAYQNGHVCLPEDKLVKSAAKLLNVSEEKIRESEIELLKKMRIRCPSYEGKRFVYIAESYNSEQYLATKLALLDRSCQRLEGEDIQRLISRIEREEDITYAALQRRAIDEALSGGILILTGGPGTGKTTVIRALLRIYTSMGLKIALAAPTGRAAKRMSEATSFEAKTIHRLLEMDYKGEENAQFCRSDRNPLEEDVIIIDEASMIDLALMTALTKAIRLGARLILIGDADQLPSVGAGNIFCDLIDSECFNTIRLTEIFRQSKESLIVTNAHAINSGKMPDLSTKNKDFFFLSRENEESIARTIVDLCKNRLPATYGEEAAKGIQVITPSRKGLAGTQTLNIMMQSALNPPLRGKKEKKLRDVVFRVGDKVMQVRNNYDITWEKNEWGETVQGMGLFNGDIGVIEDIDIPGECLKINFDDR